MTSKPTERDLLDRLHRTYNTRTNIGFTSKPLWRYRYVVAEKASTIPNGYGGHRIADFIAIDTWRSKDLTEFERKHISAYEQQSIHVFEVKVSRSDVKKELSDLSKSEAWARYAHYFWLVVPNVELIAGLVLPVHWGVAVSTERTRVREAFPPKRMDVEPMPTSVVAGLARAISKRTTRDD